MPMVRGKGDVCGEVKVMYQGLLRKGEGLGSTGPLSFIYCTRSVVMPIIAKIATNAPLPVLLITKPTQAGEGTLTACSPQRGSE
jgi:hypothetical protein